MSDKPAVDGYGRPLRNQPPEPAAVPRTPLKGQANLGFELVAQLQAAGVDSMERLEAIGAKEAWLRLRLQFPRRGDLRTLLALQGAIEGVLIGHMTPEEVDVLRGWREHHLKDEHLR